jgi:NADH-quinone oxidoreductase subunit M
MLHAGVLMKLGAYGVVRVGMGLLPHAAVDWAWLVGAIACINIVYGALSAMAQTDLKYVIAYSSVSHMGVVMLGAATLTDYGLNGSVFQMFAHGVMTGLFFALVGLVYEKAHSREIFKMGGFGQMMPGIATAFTIAGLSSLGLPATAGFVAEFLTFLGAWSSAHPWWLFPGVIGAFLTSIYVLRVSRYIFWGPKSDDPHFQHLPDARGTEWAALGILVVVIVLFGVMPNLAITPVKTATGPLLQRINSAVASTKPDAAQTSQRDAAGTSQRDAARTFMVRETER